MRRRFGGRHPLCGTGVTSEIVVIFSPKPCNARTEDSRPGPGPLILTSRLLTPHSSAARPRGRPYKHISRPVSDGNDGIVKRCVDMNHAFGNIFLDFLARALSSGI